MVKSKGEKFGFGLSPEGRRRAREQAEQQRNPQVEAAKAARAAQREEAAIKRMRDEAVKEGGDDSSAESRLRDALVQSERLQAQQPRTRRSNERVMTKEEQFREAAILRERRRVEQEKARRLDTTIADPKAEAAEQRVRNQMKEALERARQERSEEHQERMKRRREKSDSDSESSEGSELSVEQERSLAAQESAHQISARRLKERQEQLVNMREAMRERLRQHRGDTELPNFDQHIETFEEDTSSLYRIIQEIKAKKAAEAERKKTVRAEQEKRERVRLDKIAAQRKQVGAYDDDFEVDLGAFALDDAEGPQTK